MRHYALLPAALLFCCCSLIQSAQSPQMTVQGEEKAKALLKKAVEKLGGYEGIKKRRYYCITSQVEIAQSFNMPDGSTEIKKMKVNVTSWQKGRKLRIEQSIQQSSTVTTIFDGNKLHLSVNGQKRDLGIKMERSFKQEQKRIHIFWNCFHGEKPLSVAYKGSTTFHKTKLQLIEVTHPNGDKTVMGLDSTTSYPVYAQYQGLHPVTGNTHTWRQLSKEIKPVKSMHGLLFPMVKEVYLKGHLMTTETVTAIEPKPDLPDSLFGGAAASPVD